MAAEQEIGEVQRGAASGTWVEHTNANSSKSSAVDSRRTPAVHVRLPDNDIIISHELLVELRLIPPTALDVKLNPSNACLTHINVTVPGPVGAVAGGGRVMPHGTQRRPGRHGAPVGLAAVAGPGMSTESFLSSCANSRLEATPRVAKEDRKPLQRFAPTLEVPPSATTAFVEVRRRHIRRLLSNSSDRPPPNTPEHWYPCRASSAGLDLPCTGVHVTCPGTSRRSSSASRPRTSSLRQAIAQKAAQARSPDVKPVVLRMRTRGDETAGRAVTSTVEPAARGCATGEAAEMHRGGGGGGGGGDGGGGGRHDLWSRTRVGHKMLGDQWLKLGADGYTSSVRHRTMPDDVSRTARPTFRAQPRALGDMSSKRQ